MNKIYHGRAENLKDEFRADGIKYGISIGRRAPMHKMHVDCIKEIAEAGLKPVIFIGSTNTAESKFFDPVSNPLTLEQQKQQLKIAIPEYYNEELLMTSQDMSCGDLWIENFINLAEERDLIDKSVLHYRVKITDAEKDSNHIKPISEYMLRFSKHGLIPWQSVNKKPDDDDIHASEIRKFDLENLSDEERALIAAPDYIIELARTARANNPNIGKKAPITMMDLSLDRIRKGV